MKITIDTGGSPFVLVAGARDSVEEFRIVCSDKLQVAELLRAAGAVVYNRGADTVVLTFQVTTVQASTVAAEQFVLMQKGSIPTSGLITLYAEDILGVVTTVPVYLVNGTVHRAEGEYRGRTTIFKYTITGGTLTLTHP